MRGMIGRRGIRVRTRGIIMGMREIKVGMLGMQGMWEISVEMRGIRMRVQGTKVGMWNIRVGMQGIMV